jgi:uncharacterized protein (DUF433 family)
MNYRDQIVINPQICGGQPVFKGARVPLRTVLASLAAGETAEEILKGFPTLTLGDIKAAAAFACARTLAAIPAPGF